MNQLLAISCLPKGNRNGKIPEPHQASSSTWREKENMKGQSEIGH